jgi:cell division protein FtsW
MSRGVFAEYAVDRPGRMDAGFFAAVMLLWGLGMVILHVTSADYGLRWFDDSYYFLRRQFIYSAIGMAALVFLASINISTTKRLLPLIVLGSLALCLLVFIPGIGADRNDGVRRWIDLPFSATVQPSEFAKFAVILFLSNFFAKEETIAGESHGSIPILGVMTFVVIIFLQKDFSTAAFILLLGAIQLFISGAQVARIVAFSVLAIPASILFVFVEPYRVNRFIAFMNPDFDIHGLNFQTKAARDAISAGGIFGEGIGAGLSRINRIPEVRSDYIFAGWTEAMGFIGVILYVILLGFFAWRGFSIALRCGNLFGSMCAFGCTASIFLQSLVNCAVVAHALPSTGIPLPFWSSGGSSLISSFCMCGIVLQVSRIKSHEVTV